MVGDIQATSGMPVPQRNPLSASNQAQLHLNGYRFSLARAMRL
jgi:hypothetical protein